MGLDTVELIMEVEQRFDFHIGNDDASVMRSVEDLAKHVWSRMERVEAPCQTSRAFYALRRALVDIQGIPRERLRPSTPTVSVFAPESLGQDWTEMLKRCQGAPPLVLNDRQSNRMGVVIGVSLLLGLFAGGMIPTFFVPFPWSFILSLFAACFTGIATMSLALAIYNPRGTLLPDGHPTLGDIARSMTPIAIASATVASETRYTHVLNEIRRITAWQMNLPLEEVKPQSEFVRDLGM